MSSDPGEVRHGTRTIDLSSEDPISYSTFVDLMGWSRSTGKHRKAFLPTYQVEGFPGSMIIPARARSILRGEKPRRSRGRPRRGSL
jgi:hypothetical protein